jgi:hypothetical protein
MPNTEVSTSKRDNHEQAGHDTAANCPIDGAMKNTRTQPQLGQIALELLFLRAGLLLTYMSKRLTLMLCS